jgi:hypothetical protein
MTSKQHQLRSYLKPAITYNDELLVELILNAAEELNSSSYYYAF